MNDLHRGVTALLKSAVTGRGEALPQGFDMEKACAMAGAHHMSTLIYEGAVRCGVPKEHPAMQQLFRVYGKAMMTSERQMLELQRVFDAFEQNGVDYMPFKGCMMKALYPRPELRMMGDADVLIRQEQYEQIQPLMQRLGFQGGENHEYHYVWRKGCLSLELHHYMVSQRYDALHAYYGSGWRFARPAGGMRHEMSVEDTFVYLFAHFAKHFGNAGVGCRHVVDLWVYLRAHPSMDEKAVASRLEELNYHQFYKNVRQLLRVWFEGAAPDSRTDAMTEYIMSNGSWGSMGNAVITAGVRQAKAHAGRLSPRAGMMLKWIYPGKDVLRQEYPLLVRAPALLPAVACVRLVRKVFSPAARRRKKTEMTALKKKSIDQRMSMLAFFGLEDN